MKFPKSKKQINKKKKSTGIKGIPLETDINKLLNILQKRFGKSKGGIISILQLAAGGFPKKTGMINGPGTGTSDDIPAMLSNGEFVFTAKAVKNAGGAKPMYDMMNKLEKGNKLT